MRRLGDHSCPDKDLSTCSSNPERVEAVIDLGTRKWWLQSFYFPLSLVSFNVPSIFICLRLRTLTHLFSVLANLASSSLLPFFLLYLHPGHAAWPQAFSFDRRAHPCRHGVGSTFFLFFFFFPPAVDYVVSVVTTVQLARREMRPDCACSGQRGVSRIMRLVSD